eukprot:gene7200-8006_t
MSLRQVGLLTAGAQPWSPRMCIANGDRFAYCSTLAIYIYEQTAQKLKIQVDITQGSFAWDKTLLKFKLHSVVSAHKKMITAISWNPCDSNILASASTEKEIIIWDISEQRVLWRLKQIKETPICIEWCIHEKDVLSFTYGSGPLFTWNTALNQELISHKDTLSFYSNITQFSWNRKQSGKIAFGHKDGSLSFLNPGQKLQKHVLRPEADDDDDDDPVQDLQWDYLSHDYLLVGNKKRAGIRLIDSLSATVIMNFKLPSAAAKISGFSWIVNAPGMFVSGDTQSGVLRVWSVSKESPVLNLKLKETGFHSLCVIAQPMSPAEDNASKNALHKPVSSTSSSSGRMQSSQSNYYQIPPCHMACTFLDGGIGLYDIGKQRWDFLRDYGHIETIFDCKFHPEDPDLLATCSFDGSIKVWNIQKMEAVKSTSGNETAIYSISWAPGDLNCLVAATSKNGCFIWDFEKGRIIMRFNEHGKNSVYTAVWNQRDSKYIASVGADCFCIVRMVDGTLVKRYKHPGAVYGCDWSPNNRDILATGCDDGLVRVYYLPSKGDTPIRSFAGHTAKVFHVRWSPLKDGILCSGSDDGTIRIWDYSQEGCVTVLEGHASPVRGLLWHAEIPEILISGSWDYSLRIWNINTGHCIEKNTDHAADVYGLTCHRQRPFIMASCSRDSTVRIWALDTFSRQFYLKLLCGNRFSDVLAPKPDQADQVEDSKPMLRLCGTFSSHVATMIEGEADKTSRKSAELFSQLFLAPAGLKNLWTLVAVLLEKDKQNLPRDYSLGIMHTRHAVKYKASEAQELETVRANNFAFSIGAPSKETKLLQAAEMQLKLGQLERYCEIMVELGEWDKALAVSPGVSMEYWKSLSKRRAALLMAEDNSNAVPHFVATGDIEQARILYCFNQSASTLMMSIQKTTVYLVNTYKSIRLLSLIEFFTKRCQFQDSVLIAQAACEGYFNAPTDQNQNRKNNLLRKEPEEPDDNHLHKEGQRLLDKASKKLADWYFHDAQPVLSACCHLAVCDVKNAIAKLIRGNELELAISICRIFPDAKELLEIATLLLVQRCERLGQWNNAISLLNTLEDKDKHLIKLCARYSGTPQEINEMHSKAGLPSMEECLHTANKLKDEKNFLAALSQMLLSPHPELALEIGISLIKDFFAKKLWTLDEVLGVTELLSCIRTEKLQQGKFSKLRNELLVICAYTGALLAIRKQYTPVILPLFQLASYMITKDKADMVLLQPQITAETEAWLVNRIFSSPNPPVNAPLPSDDQKKVWQTMLTKIGKEKNEYDMGEYMVAGSHFPSHSEAHLSMFTKRKIKGHVFFLEDGFSALPYNEALMWARVNSFSPLGSGLRINPF